MVSREASKEVKCLRDFKEAGIKTWMLTGDKGDTARMIGLLCGMLSLDHNKHPNLSLPDSSAHPGTMLV
jgi:magnesium-transporting ATPase (P-type)